MISPDLDRFQGQFGILIYPLIMGLVLVQTGFAVGFAIPGNPLLLTAGLMASPTIGRLNLPALIFCAGIGAFAGNLLNYQQGRAVRASVESQDTRRRATERLRSLLARHGSRIVVAAAFVPILRAVVPFVAGVGELPYRAFVVGSLIGTFCWVGMWCSFGSQLATMPDVAKNANWFSLGILSLVVISIVVQELIAKRGGLRR